MKKDHSKFNFLRLSQRSLAVITASLGILSNGQGQSAQPSSQMKTDGDNTNYESFGKKRLKSKLVLKLNPNYPERMLLAQHSSHSSHASHASHASHHSGSSGYSNDSSDDSGTGPLTVVVVGGALAIGGYLLGKNKNNKKS